MDRRVYRLPITFDVAKQRALIRYRPFRNSDPPALAEIWRSHPPLRGLMQPMSAALLERMVLAKPYFDRHGLIVAVDGDQPVGFVHAGFGPSEDFSDVSTELGVTCMLMVMPQPQQADIARRLLREGEDYLRRKGARVLYGGPIHPLDPFYLGLYGGSELPGVLASDSAAQALFRENGYREIDRCIVLHRELDGFQPLVDRRQVQIRRRHTVTTTLDPRPANWWQACTLGQTDRTCFTLCQRTDVNPRGSVTFWEMEPLAGSWGVHAVGLIQLEIDPDCRRQGLATFLIGEALRQLRPEGVSLVEAQTMRQNTAARNLYEKLGFVEVDQGVVFRKEG